MGRWDSFFVKDLLGLCILIIIIGVCLFLGNTIYIISESKLVDKIVKNINTFSDKDDGMNNYYDEYRKAINENNQILADHYAEKIIQLKEKK